MHHHRMHDRQHVIHAPPREADPHIERGGTTVETFLEIGGVLLAQHMQRHSAGLPGIGIRNRVHIADDRNRSDPKPGQPIGPAIGRNQRRGQLQCVVNHAGIQRPAADQHHSAFKCQICATHPPSLDRKKFVVNLMKQPQVVILTRPIKCATVRRGRPAPFDKSDIG